MGTATVQSVEASNPADLIGPHVAGVRRIGRSGLAVRAGQIGERTGLTPGSVTALLNRLESRGYLTCMRPDHDRRSLQVSLTPAGRTLGGVLVATSFLR
jgi:DNA-binding MarR family transcriptional regulator